MKIPSRILRAAALALFLPLFGGAAGGDVRPALFEELVPGPRGTWRSWAGAAGIRRDSFLLAVGGRARVFRWSSGMGLARLDPEDVLASRSYRLAPERPAQVMRHAGAVRATNANGGLSVRYYHGPRGFEFDIEIGAGATLREIALEAAGGQFTIGEGGRLMMDGVPFLLPPVAHAIDDARKSRPVLVTYRLKNSRCVRFEIPGNRPAGKLVIDPVVTYATYFGTTALDTAVAVRELADGAVLLAGNTISPDLPDGFVLSGLSQKPTGIAPDCYVAKLYPSTGRIAFASYLGASGSCSAMDLDAQGRILLAGLAKNVQFTTSNAQYPRPKSLSAGDWFLARVSPSGDSIDYSTYLNIDFGYQISFNVPLSLQAGTGDTVYLASSAGSSSQLPKIPGGYREEPTPGFGWVDTVILRYDVGRRQFDRLTYFLNTNFAGMQLDASGAVYIYGSTGAHDMPLQNAIQTAPPSTGMSAGFVAGFSGDLKSLLFSTYLGGQGGATGVQSLLFGSAGTLQLSGGLTNDSIPGLAPAIPYNSSRPAYYLSLFSVEVLPGRSGIRKGFSSGGYGLSLYSAFRDASGRVCLLANGLLSSAFPGVDLPQNSGTNRPLLGCLNQAGNDFEFLDPAGIFNDPGPTLPSAAGGLWILTGGGPSTIPYALWGKVQTAPRGLLLTYVDLNVPTPALINPMPLHLWALEGGFSLSVPLAGKGFASTMVLDLGTLQLPVSATTSTTATLGYAGYGDKYVPSGRYQGRLVVPSNPPIASDPFPVIVDPVPDLVLQSTPAPGTKISEFGGTEVQIDRARRILYTVDPAASGQWKLTATDLSNGVVLGLALFPCSGATQIFGFQLTRDGKYLYFADDSYRVQRFRADSLQKDLEFPVTQDRPPAFSVPKPPFDILAIEDDPESVVVSTPAGRLIVYDRDRPRAYDSVDFPPRALTQLHPVLATSGFVYAVQRETAPVTNPCVARYAVDSLGLQTPEEFCDPALQWGRYPEMKRFPAALVLEAGQTALGLRNAPDIINGMLTPDFYDTARDLALLQATTSLPDPLAALKRLALQRLSTGDVVGFFPAHTGLLPAVQAFFLDDNTIVVVSIVIQGPTRSKVVTVEQNWQDDTQSYRQ